MKLSELISARPTAVRRFAAWLGISVNYAPTTEPWSQAERTGLAARVVRQLRMSRIPRDNRPHFLGSLHP